MKIRLANEADDLLAISAIYQEGWQTAYKGIMPQAFLDRIPIDRWIPYITPDISRMVLVEDAQGVIGVATYGKGDEPGWEKFGELKSIYLKSTLKRKGYGGALIEFTLSEIAKNYKTVYVWVLADNWPSRHFYEKHHFKLSSRTKEITIDGRPLLEVAYTLDLSQRKTFDNLT